jgi:tetratricopeptide (TPR) repeat protein
MADTPVPNTGITIAGIRAFIAAQPVPIDKQTTAEVALLVIAATAASSKSFCDAEALRGSPEVAPATAFLSHAWGYNFLDVVAAAEAWEAKRLGALGRKRARQQAPTFFWFDVFSNPQHGATARPFEWWHTMFKENIRRIGCTLLVLAWEDPKPLKRAWCLMEIAATLEAGAEFEVVMAPREEARFLGALTERFDTIVETTCSVDVAKASAYHGAECLVGGVCKDVAQERLRACPGDLHRIFDAVERGAGLEETNKRVVERMRVWMAGVGEGALDRKGAAGPRWRGPLLPAVARLLGAQGRHAAAEALWAEAHVGRLDALGAGDAATLEAAAGRGAALLELQRLPEAEALLVGALAGRRALLGDAHGDTLASVGALGVLRWTLGDYAAAEALHREALAGRTVALGGSHPLALRAAGNLATTLKAAGRLDEAEPLYKLAYEGSRDALGERHLQTLNFGNNYGRLLLAQGKLAEALPLARTVLAGFRRVLGDAHSTTLMATNNLAVLLRDAGELPTAEALFEEALAGFVKLAGEEGSDAMICLKDFAGLRWKQGRHAEALRMYKRELVLTTKVRGESHPRTLASAKQLAELLGEEGGAARAT